MCLTCVFDDNKNYITFCCKILHKSTFKDKNFCKNLATPQNLNFDY